MWFQRAIPKRFVRQRERALSLPCGAQSHGRLTVANKFTDSVFKITALKSIQKIVLWVLAHRAAEALETPNEL